MNKAIAISVAALTAFTIAATTISAPAHAGKRERRIAAGVLLGAIGGAIIASEIHRNNRHRGYHSDEYYPEVNRRHRAKRHHMRRHHRRYHDDDYGFETPRHTPRYVQRRVFEKPRMTRWERHVRDCYKRYRSYDERSDTFIGYDGKERQCRL